MRTVVIALFILTFPLGVLLTTIHQENDWPSVDRMRSDAPPVVQETVDDAATVASESPSAMSPDEQVAIVDHQVETTDSQTRSPYQEPEFLDTLLGHLVESGVSALDSERIVGAAVVGLTECAVRFGRVSPEDTTALGTCERNVLQEAGLNEAVHRMARNEASRHVARRLALGRVAGQ